MTTNLTLEELQNPEDTAHARIYDRLEKHPDLGKNALARFAQKQRQKRQYAKQAREAAKQGASAAEKTAVSAEKLAEKVAGFVKRHPGGVVITLACLLLLFTVQSCASSLVTLGNGIIGGIGASTYPAQDGDMLGAEAAYCALEAELGGAKSPCSRPPTDLRGSPAAHASLLHGGGGAVEL